MSHVVVKGDPPHADSNFKQQQLPSFYPEHSAFAVSVGLAICAAVFLSIGSVVISATDAVFSEGFRYDDIKKCTYATNDGISTFVINGTSHTQGCRTQRLLTLSKTVPSPVYLYYRIVGMHQNYRAYRESRDDAQLKEGSVTSLSSKCTPFAFPGEVDGRGGTLVNGTTKYSDYMYNPCGLVAWSMFNDTISLYKVPSATVLNATHPAVPTGAQAFCLGSAFTSAGVSTANHSCSKKGIALAVDRESRFAPASQGSNQWTSAGGGTDPYRSQGFYAFEPGHKVPLTTDEDFMVWSRTAAFPDFRKLYRRIEVDLQPGTYLLDIEEYYDVRAFKGEKYVLLSTASWVGGDHRVLGGALLAIGCLSFVFAVSFILMYVLRQGRSTA